MPIFIFRSIIKLHFGLTEKIFNLQLTKGIIDQKFPTFYIPIYSYKMYIFYCYKTFLPGTCWKKFPIMSKVLRFHGFLVTKVHNVSCGLVLKFIFIRSMQYLQFGFSKFLYIFMHTKRTFILYIFRPTKHTFITYLFRLTKCTVNNCT